MLRSTFFFSNWDDSETWTTTRAVTVRASDEREDDSGYKYKDYRVILEPELQDAFEKYYEDGEFSDDADRENVEDIIDEAGESTDQFFRYVYNGEDRFTIAWKNGTRPEELDPKLKCHHY